MIRRNVRKIIVEFDDGSKSTFEGTEGYLRKSKSQIPQENQLPVKWPTIESVTVHLKTNDSRDDAVKSSSDPKSLPGTPEEA